LAKRIKKEYDLQVDQEAFEGILLEASKLRWRKLNDYGASYRSFGPLGVVVRLSDKIARMSRLILKKAHVADESIRDTAIDTLNYAAMLILLLDEQKGSKK